MIYLAADKHGYKAIKYAEEFLKANKISFVNFGVKERTDAKGVKALKDMKLEDMIPPVVEKVLKNKSLAILSCGTGVGVEVGANKFSGIRACLATSPKIAEWSKIYDNCNVLCLVGWNCTKKQINSILKSWFKAEYDGDKQRLKMFKTFNEWH